MAASNLHILRQGAVIASMGRAAITAARQNGANGKTCAVPGPELTAKLAPRHRGLVRDYVRAVGGDPSLYKKTVPPHLFPQWTFPLASAVLSDIPYPLLKVVNGGCRIEVNKPLPNNEPLEVRAQLLSIDDDGRRAVMHERFITGTESAPEALVAHLYAIVPLPQKDKSKKKKEKPRVPNGVREVWFGRIGASAGLDFAKLTGDFNPIHWVPLYARASGFKNTILHGFATMARAIEGLNQVVVAPGSLLTMCDVKFTRPLVLPAKVGIYVDEDAVYVGDAPGGPAYLVGNYTTNEEATG